MEGRTEGMNSSAATVKGNEAPDSFRVGETVEKNPTHFSRSAMEAPESYRVGEMGQKNPTLFGRSAMEAPESYRVGEMGEKNPTHFGRSGMEAPENFRVEETGQKDPTQSSGSAMEAPVGASSMALAVVKKKRGRPRKYAPDGSLAVALSPMPISSSIPLTGQFSGWKKSRGPYKKKNKLDFQNSGTGVAYSVGANFTPHVINVNAGEDVTMKIMSFSQQGSRAICILAANGLISNVTLRQPNSSGGTLTYEGRFEILSLTGSFMPNDNGGTKSRSGGMSVSLAGPDGRVLGGGIAGLLVAACPVQVVIGSFIPGHQQEHKPKKPKIDPPNYSLSGGGNYNIGQNPSLTSPSSLHEEDNSINNLKFSPLEINIPRPGQEEPKDPTPSKFEVSY